MSARCVAVRCNQEPQWLLMQPKKGISMHKIAFIPHVVTYEPVNVVISGTGVSEKFKLKKHDSNFYVIGTWSLTRIWFILSEMAAARYKGWGGGGCCLYCIHLILSWLTNFTETIMPLVYLHLKFCINIASSFFGVLQLSKEKSKTLVR